MRHQALPVLVKEMRARMRDWRAPALLAAVTGGAIVVALLLLGPWWPKDGHQATGASAGRILFYYLVALEGVVAVVIAPGLSAGAIAGERERRTLEFLLLTRLSCANILLGKWLSSLGFLLILLVCALPVLALAFLLGGVSLSELAWCMGIVVAAVLVMGVIGLYCSVRFPRTSTATAVAYLLSLLWMFGIMALVFVTMSLANDFPRPLQIVYAAGGSSVAALLPAGLLSILLAGPLRRALSLVSNVLLWLAFAVPGAVLWAIYWEPVYHWIENADTGPWLLIGNPVFGVLVPLFQEQSTFTPAFDRYFLPITLAVILAWAGLIFLQTVRALRRERRGR